MGVGGAEERRSNKGEAFEPGSFSHNTALMHGQKNHSECVFMTLA